MLGQRACTKSQWTACGEWHHDRNWFRGIGLGLRDTRHGRERGSARGEMQKISAEKFHARSALRRAVTSISIFMRGSERPAWIMVAAGLTSPRYSLSTGQQGSKSSRLGNM